MAHLPPHPPADAWAVTVYFAPASDQPRRQARQARRLAEMLLRRADNARPVAEAYLAQIIDPAGQVVTIEPEYPEPYERDPAAPPLDA